MLATLEFAHYDRAVTSGRTTSTATPSPCVRAGNTRYDETLAAPFDWDHSLRLFALAEPLALSRPGLLLPDRPS